MPAVAESDDEDSDEDEYQSFALKISDTVLHGYKANDKVDNLLMEIKSAKFAHNKEFADCVTILMPVLLDIACSDAASEQTNGNTKSSNAMVRLMASVNNLFKKGGWGQRLLGPLLYDLSDR